MKHTIEEYAKRCRILGHVVRLATVKALAKGSGGKPLQIQVAILDAGEVSANLTAVRRALRSLRDAGFVTTERVDDYDLYRLTGDGRAVAVQIGCKVKGS